MTRFKFQANTIKHVLFHKKLEITLKNVDMEARKDDNSELKKDEFLRKDDGTQVEPKNIKKIVLEVKGLEAYKTALATVLKIKNVVSADRHDWFKQAPHQITKDDETWITIQEIKTPADNKYNISGMGTNLTLTLTKDDFTKFKTEKNIKICNYDNTPDKAVCKDGHENLEAAVDKLVEIIDTVYDAGVKKYQKKKTFAEIDAENSISNLEAYFSKADKDIFGLENALIELDTSGGLIRDYNDAEDMDDSLKALLKQYLHLLNELKIWKEVVGLDNIDDVLRANANGFIISSRIDSMSINYCTLHTDWLKKGVTVGWGLSKNNGTGGAGAADDTTGKLNPHSKGGQKNIKAIKEFFNNGTKYRGFDIIDPEQRVCKDDAEYQAATKNPTATLPTENYRIIEKHGAATASKNFTKENIDNFRKLWPTETNFKKTRGFRPGDLTVTSATVASTKAGAHDIFDNAVAKYEKTEKYKADGDPDGTPILIGTNGSITRKCFEILNIAKGGSATKMDDIIKLIFLENDFEEVDVYNKEKNGAEAHDQAINRLDLLTLYTDFASTSAVSNGLFTGTKNFDEAMKDKILIEKTPALNTGDAKTRKEEIERLEGLDDWVTSFINTYFKSYSESDGKENLEKAYSDLSAFSSHGGDNDKQTFWNFWRNKIENKKKGVRQIIDTIDNKDRKLSTANQQELNKLIQEEGNKKARAVYQEFNALENKDAKKTNGVFQALKSLIAELKKSEPSLAELEKYSKGSGDNKTAWDFVNGVAGAKEGQKGWADWKLEQATKLLTDARNAAKAAMTDESGAAEAIGVDQQTDIEVLTEIKNLFEKCKKAHKKEGDMANLKTELTGFRDDTGNKKKAWDLVNKYKKSGESEGYAKSALKKASETNEEAKKTFDELLTLPDANAIRTEWEKGDKTTLQEEDMKRAQAVKVLEQQSDTEASELAKLLKKNSTDVYADKGDDDLEKIEKDIAELKKYKEASDDDAKGKARKLLEGIDKLGGSKEFLENWINKLEARKAVLETAKQERDKKNKNDTQNQNGDKPFYKTTAGIITFSVLAVALIGGGIAWWWWTAKSSEEENEDD